MQLLIERDRLLDALTKMHGILPNKTDVPIMRHVKLDVGPRGVIMSATDHAILIEIACPAEVKKDGRATIDGRVLHDIVRKAPDNKQIGFTLDKKKVMKVTADRTKYSLATLEPDDWPAFDAGKGDGALFNMPAAELRKMIERTIFCVSKDETRYYLLGIAFQSPGDGKLYAVATDGHRLSVKTVEMPAGADGMPDVIIPTSVCNELLRVLPDNEIECELLVSRDRFKITIGETVLISRLIEGDFPDWRRVIPNVYGAKAVISREILEKAVARTAIILDTKGRPVCLECSAKYMGLKSRDGLSGSSAEEDLTECTYEGEALKIGFNAGYFAGVLGAMASAELVLQFSDMQMGAVRFEEVDGDGSHMVILMPMKFE